MRLLPERRDPDRQGVPRPESAGHRRARSSRRCPTCCAAASPTRRMLRAISAVRASETARVRTPCKLGQVADARYAGRPELLSRERAGVRRAGRRGFLTTRRADRQLQRRTALEPWVSAQGPFATQHPAVDPRQLDSWIAIAADGSVTAYTGKCELGQGMLTAQTQLVAEELSVPLRPRHADSVRHVDDARSGHDVRQPVALRRTSTTRNLAQAGATAREALLRLASTRLGVPADQLSSPGRRRSASKTDPARSV